MLNLSYSKFELIQLQRMDSAAKSNANRKKLFFASAEDIDTAITYR